MVFFTGWMGYATAYSSGNFSEPDDAAYQRRPVVFSQLSGGCTISQGGGTVGPASSTWGVLTYAGLFSSQTGGQPLLCIPLASVVSVQAASTFSESSGAYIVQLRAAIREADSSAILPIGAQIGTTQYGAACVIGANAQICDGQLVDLALVFNPNTSAGTLPSAPGQTGALWVNGGIISVS